jgi:hypothetical protein
VGKSEIWLRISAIPILDGGRQVADGKKKLHIRLTVMLSLDKISHRYLTE